MPQRTLNVHLPIFGTLLVLAMSTIRLPASSRRFAFAFWRGINTRGINAKEKDEVTKHGMVGPDDVQQELDRAVLQSQDVLKKRRMYFVGWEFWMWEIEGWGRLWDFCTGDVRRWLWGISRTSWGE